MEHFRILLRGNYYGSFRYPDVIDGVKSLTGGLGDGERYPRTGVARSATTAHSSTAGSA
jgi:hypothetical protein